MFIVPVGDNVDNRDFPFAGTLLIIPCVLVFGYMLRLSVGDPESLGLGNFISQWALVPEGLAHGEIFGVVTHIFLHGGFGHIINNMFFLWAFVHSLESVLGTARLIGLYLLWGIAGGLAHVAASWGSPVPLVGASGAIAGVMGAYWVAFGPMTKIRMKGYIFQQCVNFQMPAGAFMVIWILMQIFGAAGDSGEGGGTAWFAHFGGFLAGATTMLCLKNRMKTRLVETRSGYLEFQSTQEQQTVTQLQEAPQTCPHCGTMLGPEHHLASNLVRCPNEACARCTYLEEEEVPIGT